MRLTGERSRTLEIPAFSGGYEIRIAVDVLVGGSDSVLVIPGFWRQRADPVMRRIAARLHEAGLTVATMDNRGHGDSGGTFGFNTLEADDSIDVVEELRRSGTFTTKPCVIGFSAGGAIAISMASRRPDLLSGLVLVSPVADFKRVFPRPNPFRLGEQLSLRSTMRPPRFWWYEKKRRRILDDACRVHVPVCIIHARNDWLVHHRHSERIVERLPVAPETHFLDRERIHAERLLDIENAPWPVVFGFLRGVLGMQLSGA